MVRTLARPSEPQKERKRKQGLSAPDPKAAGKRQKCEELPVSLQTPANPGNDGVGGAAELPAARPWDEPEDVILPEIVVAGDGDTDWGSSEDEPLAAASKSNPEQTTPSTSSSNAPVEDQAKLQPSTPMPAASRVKIRLGFNDRALPPPRTCGDNFVPRSRTAPKQGPVSPNKRLSAKGIQRMSCSPSKTHTWATLATNSDLKKQQDGIGEPKADDVSEKTALMRLEPQVQESSADEAKAMAGKRQSEVKTEADGPEAKAEADGSAANAQADGPEATAQADGPEAKAEADGAAANALADGSEATAQADGPETGAEIDWEDCHRRLQIGAEHARQLAGEVTTYVSAEDWAEAKRLGWGPEVEALVVRAVQDFEASPEKPSWYKVTRGWVIVRVVRCWWRRWLLMDEDQQQQQHERQPPSHHRKPGASGQQTGSTRRPEPGSWEEEERAKSEAALQHHELPPALDLPAVVRLSLEPWVAPLPKPTTEEAVNEEHLQPRQVTLSNLELRPKQILLAKQEEPQHKPEPKDKGKGPASPLTSPETRQELAESSLLLNLQDTFGGIPELELWH